MIFTECDTRKMEYCVDGDFYSVSTPPSSRNNTRYDMYGKMNEMEKLIDIILNQPMIHDTMKATFKNELKYINPDNYERVYARVTDEVIRDAISNGMISANIAHFRNETNQITTNTLDRIMSTTVVKDEEYEYATQTKQSSVEKVTKVKPIKTKKFKIGEHYLIHPMNNKKLRREFVVKKTIYSIKDKEVNIVIMKQINGPESTTKFTLSKEDCLKFHLKYEEGLQVCSMELDWKLLKNKK